MVKERRRLWIPPGRLAPRVALDGEESHYLARVLRLRQNDPLEVIDGAGGLWTARFEPPDHLRLEPSPPSAQQRAGPPRPLTLALAVPKRDAELAWRMAVELGATQLQPLVAQRSVVRQAMPLARWRAIVKEATEQCERLWLPELAEPVASTAWLAAPQAGVALLACARQQADAATLPASSLAAHAADEGVPLTLAIGPEGGWSPEEEALAVAAGWQRLDLGPAILRTATAAVAAVALVGLGGRRG